MSSRFTALLEQCNSSSHSATTTQFNDAAERAKQLQSLSNEVQLELYSLYKQSTIGDVNTAKPGMFNAVAGVKWLANSLVCHRSVCDRFYTSSPQTRQKLSKPVTNNFLPHYCVVIGMLGRCWRARAQLQVRQRTACWCDDSSLATTMCPLSKLSASLMLMLQREIVLPNLLLLRTCCY